MLYTNGSKSSKQNQQKYSKQKKTNKNYKTSKAKAAYKYEVQLNLDKPKKQEITKVKADSTKINIQTLSTKLELLSNDVPLMMILPSRNRHYASNGRTINLLLSSKK